MPTSSDISRFIVVVAVPMLLAACQRSVEPTPADVAATARTSMPANIPDTATPAMPAPAIQAPTLPPPPLPEDTQVTYQCQDGNELTVTYTFVSADLHWPDGREVQLTRAASASKSSGDLYAGGKVSLRHDGNSIQLRDGGTAAVTCSESEATA